MKERPYERLIAWREAYQLCLRMYELTARFPHSELFALTSQMRRAAYSVILNIVEGNVKQSLKERRHFFEISIASLEELHCCCRLARDLKYIDGKAFENADDCIQRTSYLLHKLRASSPSFSSTSSKSS